MRNSTALAKYLSTRMNRPLISPTIITRSQNIQVSINLIGVFLAPKTHFTISKNDNFYSNDHLKSLAEEEQNQDMDSNAILGASKNSGEINNKATPLSNNNGSKTQSAKDSDFNDEDNDEKLMSPLKKSKWMLADDPLKAIKLYFKSLGFQDMA